jgi:ATP-dependent protease ClpP protease subunit
VRATGVVLGECSSAALLVFGACQRRFATPYSTFFFHRMRWQSEKRVASEEAQNWVKHFGQLEADMDELQARLFGTAHDLVRRWTRDSCYLTGTEIAQAGLADLIEI